MAKVNVTTKDGELVEIFDCSEYDFSKAMAWGFLSSDIKEAIDRAEKIEAREAEAGNGGGA